MNKDIITINLENGKSKDMEIILTYYDKKTHYNYILYKDPEEKDDECYAAKYSTTKTNFELNTNLTDKEISMLELILNTAIQGEKNEN